jgi:hypothetical protein
LLSGRATARHQVRLRAAWVRWEVDFGACSPSLNRASDYTMVDGLPPACEHMPPLCCVSALLVFVRMPGPVLGDVDGRVVADFLPRAAGNRNTKLMLLTPCKYKLCFTLKRLSLRLRRRPPAGALEHMRELCLICSWGCAFAAPSAPQEVFEIHAFSDIASCAAPGVVYSLNWRPGAGHACFPVAPQQCPRCAFELLGSVGGSVLVRARPTRTAPPTIPWLTVYRPHANICALCCVSALLVFVRMPGPAPGDVDGRVVADFRPGALEKGKTNVDSAHTI